LPPKMISPRAVFWPHHKTLSQYPSSLGLPVAFLELPHSLCTAGSPAVVDVPSVDGILDQLCPEVCWCWKPPTQEETGTCVKAFQYHDIT
jgi:hypothetical protein